jgi:hypothetical protein
LETGTEEIKYCIIHYNAVDNNCNIGPINEAYKELCNEGNCAIDTVLLMTTAEQYTNKQGYCIPKTNCVDNIYIASTGIEYCFDASYHGQ